MNFKKYIIIISILFLSACNQFDQNNKNLVYISDQKYSNTGFALIYDNNLDKIKVIDDRSLFIHHKFLKRKSSVKITNPKNGKSLIAEVKSNKQKFSDFYNSVISRRIAEDLELDFNEPYLQIVLISKDSTFIAKKTKTFDAEKKVAEKAPIDGIQINDLNKDNQKKEIVKKNKFSYSVKIADFYYKDTAQIMLSRIKNETSLNDPKIQELSKTKFRVLIGPFDDIKSLKETFEKLKSLNFENIEMLRNV